MPLLTWRKARDAAGNMVSIHMEINKSLRQLKYIDQEALWKYNIEENVGFKLQNEPVNHRCCDYLSEDIYVGMAHTSYNLQYMAHI